MVGNMRLWMPGSVGEHELTGDRPVTYTHSLVNDPPYVEYVLPSTFAMFFYLFGVAWWWMRTPPNSSGRVEALTQSNNE